MLWVRRLCQAVCDDGGIEKWRGTFTYSGDGMKYFRYETSESEIHLYPLVCWHIGAPQSDAGFINDIIERIKRDPKARWVYLGDGGECALKTSKGDVYTQTMSPMAQQNELVRLLTPIKDKGLFGIKGNHGNRIYKETGLDFDETLMAKLGLPYLGVSAFWHLRLGVGAKNPVSFSIFSHHGVDSGVSIGSKTLKGQAFDRTFIADAILTAHSHVSMDLPPRYYATLSLERKSEAIKWNQTCEYICGSAYDSRTGYAEEKGYPPLLPSHLVLTFKIGRDADGRYVGKQSAEIIRKEDI